MKNIVFIFCCMFFLQACESSNEQSAAYVGSEISFSLKDVQGNDLLNPAHPNYYSRDSIKVYNTEGVLINYPIGVFNDETGVSDFYIYYINQMCNDEEIVAKYCKRYWHWNSTDVDTVEVFLKQFDENMLSSYKYKINGVEYAGDNIQGKIVRLVK